MITIPIEIVEAFVHIRRAVNTVPLENIQFTREGKPIETSKEDIKQWQFTGLSNIDYAITVPIEQEGV